MKIHLYNVSTDVLGAFINKLSGNNGEGELIHIGDNNNRKRYIFNFRDSKYLGEYYYNVEVGEESLNCYPVIRLENFYVSK